MKKFINLFLILISLAFSSCLLTVPKDKRECYNNLKVYSSEHWKFSNNDSILLATKEFWDGAASNVDCINKMNSQQIRKLFGKPHEILQDSSTENTSYHYYFSEGCYDLSLKDKSCIYFYFIFNSNDVCSSFNQGGILMQRDHQ